MAGSIASVFGEAEDFLAALRAEGFVSLLISGDEEFRARLTQIRLHDLCLSIGDERLARIAIVVAPPGAFLVAFAMGGRPAPIWGGIELAEDELITLRSGQRVHTRIDDACKWGVVRLPIESLGQYGNAMLGPRFALPCAARWRPPRAALKQFRSLQRAALGGIKSRAAVLVGDEAAHGLEQQLIHALIECLSVGPIDEMQASIRRETLLADFEDQLEAEPFVGNAKVVVALGVSRRMLQDCCDALLGMSPSRYVRLRSAQGRQGLTRSRKYWRRQDDLV